MCQNVVSYHRDDVTCNNWSFPRLLSSPPLGSAVRRSKPTVKLKLAAINQIIAEGLLGLRQIDVCIYKPLPDCSSVCMLSVNVQHGPANYSGSNQWAV